jgi:hypothetical protein
MPRALAAATLLCAGILGACGGGNDSPPATTASSPPPSLATTPAKPGEIVAKADASPMTHGPYTLDGTYLARFQQYAPEDPSMGFADQTQFVASLDTRAGVQDAKSIDLFKQAAARGRARITAHGRYYLDVLFGDFPYVVRLTPLR